jgi:hypothetical protein
LAADTHLGEARFSGLHLVGRQLQCSQHQFGGQASVGSAALCQNATSNPQSRNALPGPDLKKGVLVLQNTGPTEGLPRASHLDGQRQLGGCQLDSHAA